MLPLLSSSMLLRGNRPRLDYRRHVLRVGLSHSWLENCRVGRSGYCCRRRSILAVFGFYATAVLLLQNTLIAFQLATRDAASTTTITRIDYNSNISTNSTVNLRSVVASTAATTVVVVAAAHAAAPAYAAAPAPRGPASQQRALMTENLYYSRRQQKVNEYRHNAVLVPSDLCRPDTFMVILVHSSPTNVDRREAIRMTWGDAVLKGTWPSTSQQNVSTISRLCLAFVLGLHANESVNRAVRQEHARYNDIVQGDFIDHYHNMTLKSLLDLKVVDERCPAVLYLLKSDDDMVINLPYLVDILATRRLTRSFMGPYNPGSRVYREGVWKLTLEEFPFAVYPPYESGSAYVITGDLIHELFVTAEYVPHIFVDDVYVTGILGRILGVTHVRQRGFAYWGSKKPTACDLIRRRIITGTKMHPQRLCALWNDLQLNPKC